MVVQKRNKNAFFITSVFYQFFFQAAKMDLKRDIYLQENFHISLEEESLSHLFRHVSEIANETKGGTVTQTLLVLILQASIIFDFF